MSGNIFACFCPHTVFRKDIDGKTENISNRTYESRLKILQAEYNREDRKEEVERTHEHKAQHKLIGME